METQTPQSPAKPYRDSKLRALYWIAAIAMAIATVLDALDGLDWMAIAGRGALIAALVLLATAKSAETRAKKIAIYALAAVSLGLLVARMMD